MNHNPIKRHEALKSISREHHFGLLICWKIREGFRRNIDLERIKKFTDWSWKNYLVPHFNFEEKYLFPILSSNHEHVKKALAEHRRLERLFQQNLEIEKSLSLIEEELEQHIRFEERVLFNEIQSCASPSELELISERHDALPEKVFEDEFWK